MTERSRCCRVCGIFIRKEFHQCRDEACRCHSSDKDWEERLNLIWNRAHIPEYADDAKVVIIALIKQLLSDSVEEERQRILRALESEKLSPEIFYDRISAIATLVRIRAIINSPNTHGRD